MLCVCFLPTLTGCWDRVEVNDLAIITAAAIDRMEDGTITISVQLFIPRSITSGETGEDPSQGSTFVREGTGENLAYAVAKLQANVPRKLFWGHCKMYIFGEEQARSGIRNEIDFLTRHPSPRGNSIMYVSKGEAKDILMLVPPLERYSGEALKKLTIDENGMKTTLMDIDKGLIGDSESLSMPYIQKLSPVEQSRKSFETIPVIVGTAIFKKDKMVGTLNMKETRGLLWLKDKVKGSTISIKPKEEAGNIIMTPTVGNIKYNPQIIDGRWIMNLNINMEGDIVQNETNLNLMNENILKKMKSQFEETLKERVAQTVEKIQQEYKADVIGFGKRFHQKYPKEWKKVREKWDEQFAQVKVNVNVYAKVRRSGYIGPPAGLPLEEVEQ